jgi:hypothetical protein
MSGFVLSYTANMFILVVLYDFCLLHRKHSFQQYIYFCRGLITSSLRRNGSSSIVPCVFISAGTCLTSSYLAVSRILFTCLPAVTKQRMFLLGIVATNCIVLRTTLATKVWVADTKGWKIFLGRGVTGVILGSNLLPQRAGFQFFP